MFEVGGVLLSCAQQILEELVEMQGLLSDNSHMITALGVW